MMTDVLGYLFYFILRYLDIFINVLTTNSNIVFTLIVFDFLIVINCIFAFFFLLSIDCICRQRWLTAAYSCPSRNEKLIE